MNFLLLATMVIDSYRFASGTGAAYADMVIADAPYVYWRLGETSGITAVDQMGHANGTYSPNSAGAWTGGTLGVAGVIPNDEDKAADVDASVPGYISSGGDVDALDGLSALTAEAWVKFTGAFDSNPKIFLAKGNGAGASSWGLRANDTGVAAFEVFFDSGATVKSVSGTTFITTSAWHHIVGRYDGTNVSVWVDGVKEDEEAATGTFDSTTEPVSAGADGFPLGGLFSWDGPMDEVAVYATALSDTQILEHYTGGAPSELATDDFDSYDDADHFVPLDAAANWTNVSPDEVWVYNPSGTDGRAYADQATGSGFIRNVTVLNANHYAEGTLYINSPSGAGIGPAVRLQSGEDSGYGAELYSDGTIYVIKLNAGTKEDIASSARTLVTGNRIKLSATGTGSATRLTVYEDTGSGFVPITGLTDLDPGGTYLDGGFAGIVGDTGSNTEIALTNWAAGNN
jgi:hypothetical protein